MLRELIAIVIAVSGIWAGVKGANVTVTMNNVSKTMVLTSMSDGTPVETGEPTSMVYKFDAPAGEYMLTAFAADSKTVNGTIVINLTDGGVNEFKIITCTAYATNAGWSLDKGDYTFDVSVSSREGVKQTITIGRSTTSGRATFLALNGNSYYASFIPAEVHRADNYMSLYKSGTLTANINVTGAIPQGEDYVVTIPADADFEMNMKFAHFIDFTPVKPVDIVDKGDSRQYNYFLAKGQVYNYRTSMPGKLTMAGYFTMSAEALKRPELNFSIADYEAFPSSTVNHDVTSNQGYETGDIFLNINPAGHLDMNIGDTYNLHAMRTWQLTDNSTNNYFIEPDFHYTVTSLDGKSSDNIVSIEQTPGSAWSRLKAVGDGIVIVTVTYDAIALNTYDSSGNKKPYMGGEYWGAIWPENTGVFVVTVGQSQSAVIPNMLINQKYNNGTLKLAGENVDAEHDVFYYLDTQPGALYTFTPDNVSDVTIAYPLIGERMAQYSRFGADGVTKNEDGSFTLLLKEGRQIVRMTDLAGQSVYQVITAKCCKRDVINSGRPGSKIFQPGDEIKIQYSGLRHPANKLAGIYNMSAYVTYNGVPNGSSLILGSGQYTFGSSPSAQAVTVKIPTDFNTDETASLDMTEGVIQVNGYGDPIGNHRFIDPVAGRSPNFTAIAHKTYFGHIPDISIPVSAIRYFDISLDCNVPDAEIDLRYNGDQVMPDVNGVYRGTFGTYSVRAVKDGYRCYHKDFIIHDDAAGIQVFNVEMVKGDNIWDGKTQSRPQQVDGIYQISDGMELAWFASYVNDGNATTDAVLTTDIDLGDFEWTPIGITLAKSYGGRFVGGIHHVNGLYVDNSTVDNQGLFGYARGNESSPVHISGLIVDGSVKGKRYVGGILGYANAYVSIDTCANYATIHGTGAGVGGIVGYISATTSRITDCYNAGTVNSPDYHAGIVGNINNGCDNITNVFNVGDIADNAFASSIVGSARAKDKVTNAYAIRDYADNAGYMLVSYERMASGEIAYRLGDAFGQYIGEEPYPVLGGRKVKYDEFEDRYYNENQSGVENVMIDNKSDDIIYYNLSGIGSRVPYRGLNIVRKSDGTYHKIIIK